MSVLQALLGVMVQSGASDIHLRAGSAPAARVNGDIVRFGEDRLNADHVELFAREMMTRWTETANAVLLEVQRSEAFLASQRVVLKASTDLRLAQQDLSAFLSDFYGQPTRAELDDVHKSLTELRREVRALRRERREAAWVSRTNGAAAPATEDAHG